LLNTRIMNQGVDERTTIKFYFSIPGILLADVAVGQTIKAKSIVYEDRDFEAEITVVGSRIDPVTRGVAVRAQINNNELLLRPGMLMTVSLALNEESVMVVPESAVIASQGIQFVYRVDADNKVLRKQVELGRRREGQVEIRDGLDPGDRVVSDGVIRVRPGITVRPQDDDSESQSD
ncbi:MAG: efflux RND transporter periplasmic adaptor subunit, partial [Gammaproteobacteria bacterium]|nr:efflux RND transporter periplasmic adaptor subunit [Gammaproteobacteria bacterium]